MPTLVTESGIVHYETYGRGRPVILLHGWLGSWALWRQTIEELGKEFRTYALDFFGFGDSFDRGTDFSIATYVSLVNQFMERLGIVKAPLVGHSMGGTVSLGVASQFPEKIVKVVVIGSPIQGSSLNFFLKLSGYQGIARLVFTVPLILKTFVYGLTHLAAKDGKALHEMVSRDVSNVSMDSFFQSIGTLRKTDMVDVLPQMKMPVLGIYGRRDIIVSPKQSKVLVQHAPAAKEAWFENSGHFPMLDEPD
ncbi:MAG: alpha/beta fold hydrolase, partial [Aggregatilineales bacterium]